MSLSKVMDNKYLLTIEFRYSDEPDAFDSTYRNKKVTLGVFDRFDDAADCGNRFLETSLEARFPLNRHWRKKERFSKNNLLISELAYLETPFSFFAEITSLYLSDVNKDIVEVLEAQKRYRAHREVSYDE